VFNFDWLVVGREAWLVNAVCYWLVAGREAWLVNAVVDSFTESHSIRCLEILAGINEPHDKVKHSIFH